MFDFSASSCKLKIHYRGLLALGSLWGKWLILARIIGNFQSQVILSIFYILILWPVGILFRLMADPLRMRKKIGTNFVKWEHEKENLEEARKQY